MKRSLVKWVVLLACFLASCSMDAQSEGLPVDENFVTENMHTIAMEASGQTQIWSDSFSEEVIDASETQTTETEHPQEESEPAPLAEKIVDGITVRLNTRIITQQMNDDNHCTKYEVHDVHTIRVSSEQPFYSMYIEWERIPGTYDLVWDGGSLECGQHDFLHEYIVLPEPVAELEFSFHEEKTRVLANLEVFTEGSAPEDVQVWLPPADGAADILVFATHADDDVLFFGPLISYYAIERGLTVQTAFMVEHRDIRERAHERLNGLWEMGVRYYPILGTAPDAARTEFDFGLRYYASSNIPDWQTELIRRFQPFVVIGHDLDGEYGNCGHKVNAYYLTQTVVEAADPEKYPESAERYGTWDTPKLYLHLYAENEWYFDVNTPMEHDPEGRTPFQVAEDAFAHHVSQNKVGGLKMRQADTHRPYDCRPFGLYRSLVGLDTVADVMENIDPEKWR